MEIELTHWDGTSAGTIEWDVDAQKVTGKLAGEINSLAAQAAQAGEITSHPYPTVFKISTAPLSSARDLVLLLSTRWRIPKALADAYPVIKEPADQGLEVVY